ncbi:MAG: helix-turn-helix transcriptional regulator [Verrucomicrobia bacterium]|nr:helix-turn-helix transcriptional regulator [Verrucomicrobiota bacterium]
MNQFAKGPSASRASDVESLSDRELEIFQLIGQGFTTAQIVAALNIGPSTVATHRAHIQEKLHLDTLAELASRAAQWVHIQTAQSVGPSSLTAQSEVLKEATKATGKEARRGL